MYWIERIELVPSLEGICTFAVVASGLARRSRERYLEHCGRNQVLGGVGKETLKRYRLIRDRHVRYCRQHGLETWTQLGRQAFEKYGNWMYQQFADRTCYVDLTQVKAVVKWLIGDSGVAGLP